MKLGIGLYRHMITRENLRFARQCGCSHIVAHLVDYFQGGQLHGTDKTSHWGRTLRHGKPWTEQELQQVKRIVNDEGLELEAIENFDPAHWYDILLDGPEKERQLDEMKETIRRVGRAGIPAIGYNFSIAGVWGHVVGPWARGKADTVAFLGKDGPEEAPIPHGQVWNMQYADDAPLGHIHPVTHEQLWSRLQEFLATLVPIAEEAGVRLAAHPDDPPMPTLRGHARLVYQPHMYQRLLDLVPSRSNALEFCLGTIAEMTEGDVYQATEAYARQDAIAYVHFRNVRGKVPNYQEVFIDEGDVDMLKVLGILRDEGYQGVLVPDHTPSMNCTAPWHTGMAFALGYMRAAMQTIGVG